MTSQGGQASARWGKNPFPVSAVARFSPLNGDAFSIQTSAMTQALAYVDQYLAESDESEGANKRQRTRTDDGNVIAVVGEYGTGKTHLSIELLRRIWSNDDNALHVFYVDAPADNFLALYRDRFFGQLDRRDVRQRVAEYYADVVAEELDESPLTENVARALVDRQASPHEIVQRFGLRESTFQQRLQERLRSITEHEEFGTALGLFMRPEFEAAVWEWLAGHPADPVLQERGIRRTIDDDISALEAIGVFAFLYGRQRHRFVLIVDEFEKVMSRETRSATDESAVLAFKKLLEVFGQSRSLLVLSGLPDFMEVLPDDARQRIASIVRPTALSFDDTCQYVRNALGRESDDLAPFSDDSISYLVELAGGNARKVIRLCYHAYEASARSGTDVTRAMVREVARQQFEISTPADVLSDVARIIDSNGWIFERSKRLLKKPSFIADYWLPVGDDGAGCAIKVTQSVLHAPEAERLAQAAQAFHKGRGNVATVLIVNGYLAEPLAKQVNSSFSRVMTYSPMRFSEDFSAAIGSVVRRLEDASNEDRLGLVESKLDQLLRQTQSVRRAVDVVQQDSISPEYLELAVEGGIRRAFGQIAGRPDPAVSSWRLSAATGEIFRRALNDAKSLEESARADMRAVFLRSGHSSPRQDMAMSLQRTLAAGAMASIVEAFRDAVVAHTRNPRTEPSDYALSDACMLYDRYFDGVSSAVKITNERSAVEMPTHDESFWVRLESFKDLAMQVWQAENSQNAMD